MHFSSEAPDTVIEVEQLGKRFRLGEQQEADTLFGKFKSLLLYPIRNFRKLTRRRQFTGDDDPTTLWAVRDLSFSVKRGEVLGIIGHNGAGKSSVLKILSRITPPTTGRITLEGRVSSLLEVGTGFHDDLTGRDNIFMNGTILGMTKEEIEREFDNIVEFSGIRAHIDTPIKFYSSGMKVRLAFSVAAHLNPEILIIDEVLAVGDLAFQQKCLGKMNDIAESGRTIIFVSHDMAAVESLCTRAILLSRGRIEYDGTVPEAIERYRSASIEQAEVLPLAERTDRITRGQIKFSRIVLNDGQPVYPHQPLTITLTLESAITADDLLIAVKFCKNYRDVVMMVENRLQNCPLAAHPGTNTITIRLDKLHLMPGDYLVDLYAGTTKTAEDKISNTAVLKVLDRDVYRSGVRPIPGVNGQFIPDRCAWRIEQAPEGALLTAPSAPPAVG